MGDHSLIYRKALSSRSNGLAVFVPDPDDTELHRSGIQIGDVGMWSEDGSFHTLFNNCLPATHLANRNGVPKNFNQVKLCADDVSKRRYHCPGTIITKGNANKITLKFDGGTNMITSRDKGGGLGFEGSSSESAFLYLPDGAITEVLRKLIPLRNETKRNGQNIYVLMTERGWIPPGNDLFVVTGTTKTCSWSLGVCTDGSRSREVSVNISVASAAISSGSRDNSSITVRRSRPNHTDLNQTVFVRGYFLPKPSSWRPLKVLRKYFLNHDADDSKPNGILPHSPPTETISNRVTSPEYSPQLTTTFNTRHGSEASELDLTHRLQRLGNHRLAIDEDQWEGELSLGSGKLVKVAIKLLLHAGLTTNQLFDKKLKERLHLHAVVWQRLEHPNVAHFYGLAFSFGERPAMIFEDYPQGNIIQYLRANPQDSQVHMLQLLQDIARGLQYLHEFDPTVVHGDLRGANVFIDQRNHAILVDYGIVVVTESSEFTYIRTTKTATCTAPEERDREDELDPDYPAAFFTMASDIFGFATTTVEIFSCDVPSARRKNTVSNSADRRPDLLLYLQLDPRLGELVQNCWNQDPAERPSARIVLEEVENICEFISTTC